MNTVYMYLTDSSPKSIQWSWVAARTRRESKEKQIKTHWYVSFNDLFDTVH